MTAHARTDRVEMSVQEFLDWPGDGTGRKLQLVNGVPRAMAPASADHVMIQANLVTAINNHLRARGMPCRAASDAPVIPPMRARQNARAPDVTATCSQPSLSRVFEDPVLIIEVLSPSNEEETWESITALAALTSLREIVVVQSERVGVAIYRRTPAGDWPAEPETVAAGGMIRFGSIDLDLPMVEVYRMTLLADDAGGLAP